MANDREQARAFIDQRLAEIFAPEDEALRAAREATAANDMPAIEISPIQGRLLQVLARACKARSILEIGALAGYSGIWLARALPPDGRFISLEVSEKHAQVARASLARANIAAKTEVIVGPATELLPALLVDAPFDLIFIDADKPSYLTYLDWAIKLARPGTVIVADNCIRGGPPLRDDYAQSDDTVRTVGEYDRRVASDPRLLSVALAIDEDATDGFAISVVVG